MDNEPNNIAVDETAKKEKTMRTVRILWSILAAVFAFIVLLRLYSWSQGKDGLHEILSPLGMVFVGLSTIVGSRNKNLSYVLLAIALILVVSGLATMFIY